MIKSNIIFSSLKRIYKVLPISFRKKSVLVLFLLLINSILEVAGLASILPLLTILLKENIIHTNEKISFFYNLFDFTNDNLFIVFIAGIVVVIIIIKNIFSLIISRYQITFSFSIMENFALRLHKLYYKKGFIYFKQNNSNFILRDTFGIPQRFASSLVMGIINLLNEFIVLILILIGIILYSPGALMIISFTMMPVFLISYKLTKNKIKKIGEEINEVVPELNRSLVESVFGYVDVIISGTFIFFYNKIKNKIKPYTNLRIKRSVFNLAPTKIIESSMVFSIFVIIFYGLFFMPEKENLISLIGIYILAAYRIMPSINRIAVALNRITENQYNFDVIEQLNIEKNLNNKNNLKEINFNNEISLENVNFKYPDAKENILTNYNLKIKKGEIVGIIGKSGKGKTTLINILLGFLEINSGKLEIDNVKLDKNTINDWQKKLAYVQQEVYLLDASFAENIAFGLDKKEIDYDKLKKVVKSAGLEDFVIQLQEGLHSNVGQRGSKLSGGQRQRIGIARALYFGAEVLFFDEATSSLDIETEKKIIKSIEKLSEKGLTMIIVAHRESTLKSVDRIIKI